MTVDWRLFVYTSVKLCSKYKLIPEAAGFTSVNVAEVGVIMPLVFGCHRQNQGKLVFWVIKGNSMLSLTQLEFTFFGVLAVRSGSNLDFH